MRWLMRHPFKATLLAAWAGLFIVTWGVQYGQLGLTGRPLWSYELREISTNAAPARKVVSHEEVPALAGKQDGARVFLRCASASRRRLVLRLTASSIVYAVDAPPGPPSGLASVPDPPHPGLYRYVSDAAVLHGEWRTPAQLSYASVWGPMVQLATRFPMTSKDGSILDDAKDAAAMAGGNSFRHTFVRTNDAFSRGWDLDVRVPFWVVYVGLASPALPVAVARAVRGLRRRRRRSRGRCEQCGYDLRAVASSRCPECGHAIPAGSELTAP